MSRHFFFSRETQVAKKDDKGNNIPLKDDKGEVIPGKFETETVKMKDSINLDRVIRNHMINEKHVIALLDDGHEVTEKTPELKNPNKPASPQNIIEVKSRVWVQSEVSIKGDDVEKYYAALAG